MIDIDGPINTTKLISEFRVFYEELGYIMILLETIRETIALYVDGLLKEKHGE